MKRCLTILIPLFIALACAVPKRSSDPIVPGKATPPLSTATPTVAPAPTPATVPDAPPRGGSAQLTDGRTPPVVRVVPRDLIPAVFDPVHVPAADVGEQVGEASPVIGVSVDGESVAYSVTYLSGREVVNDTVGGTPIVVTW